MKLIGKNIYKVKKMDYIIGENNVYPYLIVDNWYDKKEEEKIWKELNFYLSHEEYESASKTAIAKDDNGNPLGEGKRFYPRWMYSDYGLNKSHIMGALKKQQHPQFHDLLRKAIPPHADSFTTTNRVNTLISYYEENDYYDTHHDAFLFTCLIWFAKDDSLFTGGDLILTQSNQTIQFKHNRMLLFPCYYKHKVTPIKFKEGVEKKDNGRFSITHFYYSMDN